ncbi:replication-relaxation family protein [Glycomyces sp. MUSA5-2]|uniref:replication-relaxation family protein n=1 Tax=Glycomyces sp. MUSA5-2 TaxID=2053002 RepID=UPI00300861DD
MAKAHNSIHIDAIIALAARLTARDYQILQLLAEHRIATASIIAAVFFTNRRRAAARLHDLTELGLITHGRVTGSGAHRYTLAWAGAAVCALRNGTTPPTRAAAAIAAQQTFHSAHRPHKEGVNTFLAHLHLAARATGTARVTEWLPEATAAAQIINARPDAAATLTWNDGRTLRLWYEHDRGTETIAHLVDKIHRYRDGRLPGPLGDRLLLFGLPARQRLEALQRACPHTRDLTVAATVTVPLPTADTLYDAGTGILTGQRWTLLATGQPTSLAALAD